jgi:site-specific recombinase XerD
VDYIDKERPAATDEHVFLTAVAPVKPLGSSTTVPAIARAALLRAGIQAPSLGAHLLRHTAATAMLREGAALEDIAAVLRHKSVNVTAYYSKVDFDALRLVVQPWPEVPPC